MLKIYSLFDFSIGIGYNPEYLYVNNIVLKNL